jgi:hypothetical protein
VTKKLTLEQREQIAQQLSEQSAEELASTYGVSRSYVYAIHREYAGPLVMAEKVEDHEEEIRQKLASGESTLVIAQEYYVSTKALLKYLHTHPDIRQQRRGQNTTGTGYYLEPATKAEILHYLSEGRKNKYILERMPGIKARTITRLRQKQLG